MTDLQLPVTSTNNFARSLAIQLRVVGALMMRELITRFGRENIGFLWLFFEPMIFTAGITVVWSFTRATHGSTMPIVGFAVTGYSSVLLWRNAVTRCSGAISSNQSLLYHRNVRVLDIFLSRLMIEIIGATISLIVLVLAFMAFGLMKAPADVLTMIVAWLLLSWFAIALGLVIGTITETSEILERFWGTVTYLMFPFSGAVFMVHWLPQTVRDIVLWIPMVHGVEMLRHGYYGNTIQTYESPMYLIVVNSFLLLIGLSLLKKIGDDVTPG